MLRRLYISTLAHLRHFHRSERGSYSVEAMLVTPLLFFGLMVSYSWFSAFQSRAEANKAAYTISDYVSRQTEAITPEFINGLGNIYKFLTESNDTSVRISAVRWSNAATEDGEFVLIWSEGYGSFDEHTEATLPDIEDRLPLMAFGSEVIVVETRRVWSAPFNINLDNVNFDDFITTSPRYATQVAYYDGNDDDDGSTEDENEITFSWSTRSRHDRNHN